MCFSFIIFSLQPTPIIFSCPPHHWNLSILLHLIVLCVLITPACGGWHLACVLPAKPCTLLGVCIHPGEAALFFSFLIWIKAQYRLTVTCWLMSPVMIYLADVNNWFWGIISGYEQCLSEVASFSYFASRAVHGPVGVFFLRHCSFLLISSHLSAL